jgi:hypothetical protein
MSERPIATPLDGPHSGGNKRSMASSPTTPETDAPSSQPEKGETAGSLARFILIVAIAA